MFFSYVYYCLLTAEHVCLKKKERKKNDVRGFVVIIDQPRCHTRNNTFQRQDAKQYNHIGANQSKILLLLFDM